MAFTSLSTEYFRHQFLDHSRAMITPSTHAQLYDLFFVTPVVIPCEYEVNFGRTSQQWEVQELKQSNATFFTFFTFFAIFTFFTTQFKMLQMLIMCDNYDILQYFKLTGQLKTVLLCDESKLAP